MPDQNKPIVRPFKKHVFVCTGPRCAPESSPALYQNLKQRLKDLNLHEGKDRINRSQSQCLGVCKSGPIMAVYPDSIWYHEVNLERLEQIIQQHLIGNNPVREHMLYPKLP